MRVIEVIPYSDSWPAKFEEEKEIILSEIHLANLQVHHVGSTSVKGLAAKPVIDILLEVDSVVELDAVEEKFKKIGYECKGEYGISGRQYYQKGESLRTHHIHAFNRGSKDVIRHLAFRDYLIEHHEVAREYELIKLNAATECNNNIEKYCDLKHDFIVSHEKKAVKRFKYD
jgi:GrpB-like predicted nucleotidyltransferase (UPF0157 family)